MDDRSVEFPQRYQLKKVEGTDDIYDFIPVPGKIISEGTLINKEALLQDATAALFQLSGDTALPDKVFEILSKAALVGEDGGLVLPSGDSANQTKIEIGEYTGTGLFGQSNKTSITFRRKPTLWGIFSGSEPSGNKMIVPLSNSFVFGEMPENEYGYVFMEYINPNGGLTFIRGPVTISYDNNAVSFYSNGTADAQLNASGVTYHYFAAYL